MSNRKSNSKKRREWWLICVREFRQVDDDLRKLIAEVIVTMFRRTKSAGRGITRYTHVKVTDCSVNAAGHVACPGCGGSPTTTNQVEHRIGGCIGRHSSWKEAASRNCQLHISV